MPIKVVNIKIVSALEAKGHHKYRLKALFKLRHSLIRALEYELLNNIDVHSAPLPFHERGPAATIDGWEEERIPRDFPVDSREQLWALYNELQFPAEFKSPYRVTFTGEEVFLFGLYRSHNLGKYEQLDISTHFGYSHASYCSQAYRFFWITW